MNPNNSRQERRQSSEPPLGLPQRISFPLKNADFFDNAVVPAHLLYCFVFVLVATMLGLPLHSAARQDEAKTRLGYSLSGGACPSMPESQMRQKEKMYARRFMHSLTAHSARALAAL